jgi:hypothetical protein
MSGKQKSMLRSVSNFVNYSRAVDEKQDRRAWNGPCLMFSANLSFSAKEKLLSLTCVPARPCFTLGNANCPQEDAVPGRAFEACPDQKLHELPGMGLAYGVCMLVQRNVAGQSV